MAAQDQSTSASPSTPQGRPAGAAEPVLDRDAMLARVDNDLQFLQELIELFLAESPGLLAQIRAGINGHNAESVERTAHTLKGALANFGARRACEAARDLEICACESRMDGAAARFSRLEVELDLACQALSDFLREAKHEDSAR